MLACFLVVLHFVMRRLGIAYRASVLMIRKASCRATNIFQSSQDVTSPPLSPGSRKRKLSCRRHETVARDLEYVDPTEGMGAVAETYPEGTQYVQDETQYGLEGTQYGPGPQSMRTKRPERDVCEAEVTPSRCVNGPIPPSCTDPNWPPNRPKSIQARAQSMKSGYYTNGQNGITTYAPGGWADYQTEMRNGYPPASEPRYLADVRNGYPPASEPRYLADVRSAYQADDTVGGYQTDYNAGTAKAGYQSAYTKSGYQTEMKSATCPGPTAYMAENSTRSVYQGNGTRSGYQADLISGYQENGYQAENARQATMASIYGPETRTVQSTYAPRTQAGTRGVGNVYCPDGYNLTTAVGDIEPGGYGPTQMGSTYGATRGSAYGYDRKSARPASERYSAAAAAAYGYSNAGTMNSHVGQQYQMCEDKIGTQGRYTGYEKSIPVQSTGEAYGPPGGTTYRPNGTAGTAYGTSVGTSYGTSVGTSYGTSAGTSYGTSAATRAVYEPPGTTTGATCVPPDTAGTGAYAPTGTAGTGAYAPSGTAGTGAYAPSGINGAAYGTAYGTTTVGGQSRAYSKGRPPTIYQMEEEPRVQPCPMSAKRCSSQDPISARQCGRPTGFDDGPLPRPVMPTQEYCKSNNKNGLKSRIGSAITSVLSPPARRNIKTCSRDGDTIARDNGASMKTGYMKSATGNMGTAPPNCPASGTVNSCPNGTSSQHNSRSGSGSATPTSAHSTRMPYASSTGTRITNMAAQNNGYCSSQGNSPTRGSRHASAMYSVRASGIRSVSQQDMTHTDLTSVVYDPMRGASGRRKAPYNIIDCSNSDDSTDAF